MPSPSTDDLPLVFRGRDAVATGVLTPRQLRDGRWRKLLTGTYTRRDVEVTHALLCEAAGLLLPPGSLLTGASAATVLGLGWSSPRDPVEVVLAAGGAHPSIRGVSVRRCAATPEAGTRWRTGTLASPERMAFDAAARVPLTAAVGRLDALVRARRLHLDAMAAWLEHRHDNDVVAVRAAVALVDPRAESLPESSLRVQLLLAGIDVEPQHVVRHRGRVLARVDLAVPSKRVAVEYDGEWHRLKEQFSADRTRLNALREAGWVVVHITAADLAEPGRAVALVRAALAARP